MRIGVASPYAWKKAVITAGHQYVELPGVAMSREQKPGYDLRVELGKKSLEILSREPVDFILDVNTDGLQFVPKEGKEGAIQLLHEKLRIPLVSHFVDTSVTCFTNMPLYMHLQMMESKTWVKLLWDDAHIHELEQFGVENLAYFPMASYDRTYDCTPLEAEPENAIPVSFIGGKSGTYFRSGHFLDAITMTSGVITASARQSSPEYYFFDLYYKLYRLGEAPSKDEAYENRALKYTEYQMQKLFYTATQMVAQRDRWIIFLKKQLGDQFEVVGNKWDDTYNIQSKPRLPSEDDFFNFIRRSKININVVAGHTESGVNQRTYEIPAAGGFMLHHWRPQLERDFDIGKECEVFRNENELLRKIRYYLDNPKKRIDIALAGQQRALNQHLYSHRVQDICKYVEQQTTARDNLETNPCK